MRDRWFAMKWRVRLMRRAGRRIPWKILINEPVLIRTILTQSCTYGEHEPSTMLPQRSQVSGISSG